MSEPEAQKPKSGSLSPVLLIVVLLVLFGGIVVVALAFINRQPALQGETTQNNTGVAVVEGNAFSTGVNEVEPTPIPDRALTAADGTTLNLSDLQGKYTLLYFGYTYCPDFCPSTMTDWRLIRRALGDDADRLNLLMVSVDPERDTPETLARYLASFDPAIIGATADEATLRDMVADFGAFYEHAEMDESPLYMVSHTASQFLIDPQGNFVTVYSFGTPIDVITADLRAKLARQ